jgi:uncharacterized protein (TIGR02266 family)
MSSEDDRRREQRIPVVLRVDYDDADDLISDYTQNLSSGGTCVAGKRQLEPGTEVKLALSFPGLVEPIRVDGIVRWTRGGDEPTIGIEFLAGVARDQLAAVIERIQANDPTLLKRTLRVLVVEDNQHVADLIASSLGRSSAHGLGPNVAFDLRTAKDGREALEILRVDHFDAVIVDIYLPVLDGASVISALRGELGKRQLPIIAVSAGGDSARQMAMQAGADIFIDKPMRLRQVVETMRKLMKLEAP